MTNPEIFNNQAYKIIEDYNYQISIRWEQLKNLFIRMGSIYSEEYKKEETKAFINIEAAEARRNIIYLIMINTSAN